ncbi:MAG: adenine phosphoribosyltransferase [Erysipelotrichales bacterium]|nr:adenine phosphoribosyltransferase [Erysipelotrichales bacterium]
MKILKNDLQNELNLRTEKDYPVKGVEFIDITPLVLQKDTLKEITDKFVIELGDKNVDYIVAPEARGFLFGAAVANELNVGLISVRKKGKLPPSTVARQVSYEKEYGADILELPKLVNDTYENKNFYIIDDIYATGNTLKAIKEAIIALGGNVVGEGVVMNIVELNNNKELFSLIDINED